MSLYELIRKKRNGLTLTGDEIRHVVNEYTNDNIPDYQMSALLMAIYFQGLSPEETQVLTQSMRYSGEVIDLSMIPGIKVDKHSTGGVGDKVSIILAPIVAAAGVTVPMISGRGLGHTGGTLDKLQSIPGFRTDLSRDEFIKQLQRVGCCIIGQSDNIVPADRKLYALRDVTATVESIPLVTASILSKKLAEGIDALVLDVKTGKGAFMSEPSQAEELARNMIRIGEEAAVNTVAYITGMDEPLGRKIGNWLEIEECIDALRGQGPDDLMENTFQLCGAMLHLGRKAASVEDGIRISKEMVDSGKAWEKFLEMTTAQGGDTRYIEEPGTYDKPKFTQPFLATGEGYISSLDAFEIGMGAVSLGAGRMKVDDRVDPGAGIVLHSKTGDRVKKGMPLMTLMAGNEERIRACSERLRNAVQYSPEPVEPAPLIRKYLDLDHITS